MEEMNAPKGRFTGRGFDPVLRGELAKHSCCRMEDICSGENAVRCNQRGQRIAELLNCCTSSLRFSKSLWGRMGLSRVYQRFCVTSAIVCLGQL